MTNKLSALKKWERPFPVKKTPSAQENAKTEDSQEYFKQWSQAEDGLYPFGNNGQWHGGIHFDKNTECSLEQGNGVRCIADGEVIAYRFDQSYLVADFGDRGKATYSSGFVLVRHRLQFPSALMPAPAVPANTPVASASSNNNATTSQAAAANPPPRPEGPSLVLYSLYMHLCPWKSYLAKSALAHPGFWVSEALKREVGEKANDDNPGWNTPPGESAAKGLNVRNSGSQKIGWLPRGARLTLAPGDESDKWRQIASIDQGKMQFNPATNPGQEIAGWVYVQELATLPSKPACFDAVYIPPNPLPIKAGEIVGHLGEYQRARDVRPSGTPSRPLLHLELFGGADVPVFIDKCRKLAAQLDDAKKPLLKIEVGAKLVLPWNSDLKLTAADHLVLSADSPKEGKWIKVKRGTFEVVPRSQLPNPYKNQTYADGRILYRVVKQDGSEITEAQYNGLSAAEKQNYPKRKVLKLSERVIWIERQHWRDAPQKIMTPTAEVPAWSAFPLQVGKLEMLPAAYTRVIDVKPLPSLKDDQGRQWWEVTVGIGKNRRIKGWACEKGHPKVKRCSPWEWPGFDLTALDETTPLEWIKRKFANNYTPDNVLLKKLFEVVDTDENGQLSPRELRLAWQIDWQIQALSRLVIEHDSEWGQPMSLWDELDNLFQEETWEEEKKRITKLQWWNQVKGKHGFPNSIQVHHFHPLAVIENFRTAKRLFVVTAAMLKKVYTSASMAHLQTIADYLNMDLEKYKLDTPLRLSHFFAQSREEAGSFAKFIESLDYAVGSVVDRTGLMQWLYFRNHQNEAVQYGRTNQHPANQEAIANRAYANKNGNDGISSGDGWRYRGRGLKQLTGKGNYNEFSTKYAGVFGEQGEDFVAQPELVGENPKYAVRSAIFYWLSRKLYDLADEGATDNVVTKICLTVNGGTTGLENRKVHFRTIWNAKVFEMQGD
jgi:predicted chitinase